MQKDLQTGSDAFQVTPEDRFIVSHFCNFDLLDLRCQKCSLQGCIPVQKESHQAELDLIQKEYFCLTCTQHRIANPIQVSYFKCEICLQDDITMDQMALIEETKEEVDRPGSKPCDHIFCRGCLSQYIQSRLQTKMSPNNTNVPCPGNNCTKVMTRSQIKDLLPSKSWSKLKKLELLRLTPAYTGEQVVYDSDHKYFVVCPDCVYGHNQTMMQDFCCKLCEVKRCAVCSSKAHSTVTCLEQYTSYAETKFQELITVKQV